jgi:transmembrane sensor
VAPDAERPLEVVTAEARVRALGTRFSVRRLHGAYGDSTRLMVYESRVELCPAAPGECRRLHGGQQAAADDAGLGPVTEHPVADAPPWVTGHLEVEDRPLGEVLAELARYHRGVLHFDEAALAGLQVSGVLPLDNMDRALRALAGALPIRVHRYSPWVVAVTRAR